jgi:hypothetical protein
LVICLDGKTAAQVLGRRPRAVRTSAYRGLNRLVEGLERDVGDARDVTQWNGPTLREVR